MARSRSTRFGEGFLLGGRGLIDFLEGFLLVSTDVDSSGVSQNSSGGRSTGAGEAGGSTGIAWGSVAEASSSAGGWT
jgi:hypothetical protein